MYKCKIYVNKYAMQMNANVISEIDAINGKIQ